MPFFAYLISIAVANPLTLMQSWYNTQAGRSLDITSNYWIDAQLVDRLVSGPSDRQRGYAGVYDLLH